MFIVLVLVVGGGVLTRPSKRSFKRQVLEQLLEEFKEEQRRQARGFLQQGIVGELALCAESALARQVLEQATRYKNCIVSSVAAFNLGRRGSVWYLGYANTWWSLPKRMCDELTDVVAGSDWWERPLARLR